MWTIRTSHDTVWVFGKRNLQTKHFSELSDRLVFYGNITGFRIVKKGFVKRRVIGNPQTILTTGIFDSPNYLKKL